jgi:predicted Zn-dependent peptidase
MPKHNLAAALFVTVALAAGPVGAQQQTPEPSPVVRHQLANGLDVILLQDRRIPVVYVHMGYHVGSGNERLGKSGYAHLFEHLMFQGSQHTGVGQHFPILRGIGGRGENGTTNVDRTNYFQSVPAAELETALWLESDRMGYLLLDQAGLDVQREVVRNERRQRYENVPFSQEIFAVAKALYPEKHPYRNLTIGLPEDLERATLEDARQFFARWYAPANATLLLAGDFEVETARALVDKWFGTFPASARPQITRPAVHNLSGKQRLHFSDPLATFTRVRYVWPSPAFFDAGDAELDLIADLLASNTGRLRKLVFYDRAIAQNVSARQVSMGGSGEFHVVLDLLPGASIGAAEIAITSAIAAIRGNVRERELKQALAAREARTIRGLESLADRGWQLQQDAHFGRALDPITGELARYRKVQLADIHAAATRFLTERRVEVITEPKSKPSALVVTPGREIPQLAGRRLRPGFEAAQPLEARQSARQLLAAPPALRGGN